MIATDATIHVEFNQDERSIECRVVQQPYGDGSTADYLSVRVREGYATVALYGPPDLIVGMIEEMAAAAKAALGVPV